MIYPTPAVARQKKTECLVQSSALLRRFASESQNRIAKSPGKSYPVKGQREAGFLNDRVSLTPLHPVVRKALSRSSRMNGEAARLDCCVQRHYENTSRRRR